MIIPPVNPLDLQLMSGGPYVCL